MSWPTLNWKETAALVDAIRPALEGLFVDRVVVPTRLEFAEGFVRGEWALRLTGRKSEATLMLSVRPRRPYLALGLGKGPRAAEQATHSPFSLGIAKELKGARILGIEALPQERILVLWLTLEGVKPEKEKLGLVLCLIPAMPEALLVRAPGSARADSPGEWKIIHRSRSKGNSPASGAFAPPSGAHAPLDPPVREELFASPESFYRVIENELLQEAFELRRIAAEKAVRELLKQAKQRHRQSSVALKEASAEADWRRYADWLKSGLAMTPDKIIRNSRGEPVRVVTDFETGESIEIPCDPKLGASEQVEKFYQLARRKARRADEAQTRMKVFEEKIRELELALDKPASYPNWKDLESLERKGGIFIENKPAASSKKSSFKGGGKVARWLGKIFTSKDGLPILVGRSKDENLELTFKHARGNDIWLHVRGRPGAHVVVPVGNGKSAPLETLLDAAALCIFYSGGEKWGKTEVDYAFKKHVKRIKDSSEASYTNNKTLTIEPDAKRLKRLLSEPEAGR